MGRVLAAIIFLFLALGSATHAAVRSCETLTAGAEAVHGLPPKLLTAIAHTESGRTARDTGFHAWPWTSNIAGKGRYYRTRAEALAHLTSVLEQGITSFDVGCMQLNYRWHGQNFSSLSEMLEPARNVDYAALYLKELKSETGSWEVATRFYHSRDPARGRAYLGRVRAARARLGHEPSGRQASAPEKVPAQVTSLATGPSRVPRALARARQPLSGGRPTCGASKDEALLDEPQLGHG